MASNFFGDGDVWNLPVPYVGGINSGQGMLVGVALFGVAMGSRPQNELVPCRFRGVYELAKEPSLPISLGARLFWDNTNRRLTTTAAGNMAVGIAVASALAADATVRARLARSTAAGA